MKIMASMPVLNVLLYGQQIGTLTHLPGDKNLFSFDQDYIDNPNRPILSLSFKDRLGELITTIKTTQIRLPPFFANLLPEGPMREYLALRANINPTREFFLLSTLGSDLPGAITIQATANGDLIPFKKKSGSRQEEKSAEKKGPLRFSLAGVQLKFSAFIQKENMKRPPIEISLK
jgi:serine/threonine-protein kinase HipA